MTTTSTRKSEWQQVEDRFKKSSGAASTSCLVEIEKLKQIKQAALSPAQKLKAIRCLLDQALVEYPKTISGPLPLDIWKDSLENVLEMIEILNKHPNISFTLEYDPRQRMNYNKGACDDMIQVMGDLSSIAGDFVFQFFASLNLCETNVTEYETRLGEESTVVLICHKILIYLKSRKDFQRASQVAELLVNLMHYKSETEFDALQQKFVREESEDGTNKTSCMRMMDGLFNLIYEYGDEDSKTFATLCHIYHLSVNDNYSDALLLLKSFLDEAKYNILKVQPCNEIHIRFNRAIAQLGLCAFRSGHTSEAHSCLSWLFDSTKGGARLEELLGQGCPPSHSQVREPVPIEEDTGRIPPLMHINLPLLEEIYLICVVL